MEMVLGLMTIAIAWILMVVLEWVWLKPKKLEKWLRQHGFSGNSYRLLHGDIKDRTQLHIQAASQPISISDSHQRRILPYDYHILQTYGTVQLPFVFISLLLFFQIFLFSITLILMVDKYEKNK